MTRVERPRCVRCDRRVTSVRPKRGLCGVCTFELGLDKPVGPRPGRVPGFKVSRPEWSSVPKKPFTLSEYASMYGIARSAACYRLKMLFSDGVLVREKKSYGNGWVWRLAA